VATQIVPASKSADHPTAPLSPAAVDAMRRLEAALVTPDTATVEKVRTVLGYEDGWKPSPHLGETATYLTVWSQVELNELFERVGGTVTTRQAERSASDGTTWTATELTLTVQVPDVGPVDVVTDIEDDPEHGYRTDIPVVAVARYRDAADHLRALAKAADFDGCLAAQDEMRMCRCQLEDAGRLDLIGSA
jgi:CheY-like chemotaxis protein